MKKLLALSLVIISIGCADKNKMKKDISAYQAEEVPADTPLVFKEDLIPDDKIIHKGILSPDLQQYYYTLSEKDYSRFDVMMIQKTETGWSEPKPAFFNSNYSEHGMSFSPDGNSFYFSSTRPLNKEGDPGIWHIWRSEKVSGKWSTPELIDIPNLKGRHMSHPTLSSSGNMYFHSSDPDYSNMHIYLAEPAGGKFGDAKKVLFNEKVQMDRCTPHISADENYLVFAGIGEQLDLYICKKEKDGQWSEPQKLPEAINTQGQGNPFITPDHQFLFYTREDNSKNRWEVCWIDISAFTQK
ncbi:hypothetical protein GWK08_05080 [Leptobacterium flavescens]|uniref:Uncharacterized protein n=1 Tax=Leptobacterium flavescens TaxID=472055 RepID=A0A6P0UJS7_9FLAO|nr:PD40 domain-containing protein [Leptobacterium flavescens]NER12802.1 hypothetical protein [Leptobacterium flavescens]